ncbi:DMT family transporter [Rhizobium rhizogenes]|uniref:DMT family transporter n=1 Tax=Rhizobium rhizogenes TaxID=359 RepID=UPI003ED17196
MHRASGWNIALALVAGAVLAVMIDWNSLLARHSSPLFASWTAHGIGVLASLALVTFLPVRTATAQAPLEGRWPLWSYLGGIPGAFTVLLAAITVNSALGLAGTLALMLIGQMVFGIAADAFGILGLRRVLPDRRDICAIALVLFGSIVIILARS